MKKGFSVENLYEHLEEERLQEKHWEPTIPMLILKTIYDAKMKGVTWRGIKRALEKSGFNYSIPKLRYNYDRAIVEKLFDSE